MMREQSTKISLRRGIATGRCICVALMAVVTLLFAAGMPTAQANVSLPRWLFSDHMVLQREAAVPIWGTADPGEKVTVTIAGQTHETTADSEGKWRVQLAPLFPGDPQVLTVAGENTLAYNDVQIGDVWICAGQSNMKMQMSQIVNAEVEIAAADQPAIRLCSPGNNVAPEGPTQTMRGNGWVICTPQSVKAFSAVGYFFAKRLNEELQVPIGLINIAWSGTPAEAWMDPETLASIAPGAAYQADWKNRVSAYDADKAKATYDAAMAQYAADKEKAQTENKTFLGRPPTLEPSPLINSSYPSTLYNALLPPLIPYGIRGVIWYQGEHNIDRGKDYRIVLPALIASWRKLWGQGDFPFYYAQLANFKAPNQSQGWVDVRDSQRSTLAVKNTGMAVTNDLGESNNIHPLNKQEVGRRLGLWALAKTYGKNIVCSGPLYRSHKIEGATIRIAFDYVGGGLASRDGLPLKWFTISGADGQFVPAEARIEGDTVVVSSSAVPQPTAVRYAWKDDPQGANLGNKEGLPASLFETTP